MRVLCAVCFTVSPVIIGMGYAWQPLSGWAMAMGGLTMQPATVWIIYTLMFGYPVPTYDEHEFTNQTACEIHKHSYSEQIVDAFKLVCSTKTSAKADRT
jgi:hypothetical protein